MKSNQNHSGKIFTFTLNKFGPFPKFQIEILTDNYCYFKSKEIIISEPVIQEIIELIKTGSLLDDVSRFEFRDADKSFLLFINHETTIIGQTYNLISGKREEFIVKDINKRELLAYIEKANGEVADFVQLEN